MYHIAISNNNPKPQITQIRKICQYKNTKTAFMSCLSISY